MLKMELVPYITPNYRHIFPESKREHFFLIEKYMLLKYLQPDVTKMLIFPFYILIHFDNAKNLVESKWFDRFKINCDFPNHIRLILYNTEISQFKFCSVGYLDGWYYVLDGIKYIKERMKYRFRVKIHVKEKKCLEFVLKSMPKKLFYSYLLTREGAISYLDVSYVMQPFRNESSVNYHTFTKI